MLRKCLAVAALVFTSSTAAQNCAPFTDVLASSTFCDDIQWIFNRGITLGCAANQFCPAQFVRRDQMAAFLYRLGFENAFLHGGNSFGETAVLGTNDDRALVVQVGDVHAMRFEPTGGQPPNVIGGSFANAVTAGAFSATIGGGGGLGGLLPNHVSDAYGTVAGGSDNRAGDDAGNPADKIGATVSGGSGNRARGAFSTVSGGAVNNASNDYGVVAGGYNNHAHAYAFAAGGATNNAAGIASFAAGQLANANADNCAVFSLWGNAPGMQCFGISSIFLIAARRGMSVDYQAQHADNTGRGTRFVYIGDRFPPFTITTWTNATLGDNGVWNSVSDADKKHAFAEFDKRAILEKLAALPIRSWSYTVETEDIRHIGPTSQDFQAAFGLGNNDKTIGMIDGDGVALAAIQGLNEKLEAILAERDARLATLAQELAQERRAREAQKSEIAELRQAVAAVLSAVKHDDRVATRAP